MLSINPFESVSEWFDLPIHDLSQIVDNIPLDAPLKGNQSDSRKLTQLEFNFGINQTPYKTPTIEQSAKNPT